MSEVLIVARTRFSDRRCIGGRDLDAGANVRLMTRNGLYQPAGSQFQIGHVYEIAYLPDADAAPHIEDVRVQTATYVRAEVDVARVLLETAPIVAGPPSKMFDGKLLSTSGHRGYIGRAAIPERSVEFWRPDSDIYWDAETKTYTYGSTGSGPRVFTYAGETPPDSSIPAGAVVRISLAKWWKEAEPPEVQRCYTQVSGWFPAPGTRSK